MRIVQGWIDLPAAQGVVLTIGVFDGVHLGHQALIRNVVERARTTGRLAAVLTFHPHPRSVVAPESNWGYLCSLEERMERIAELGVDLLMVLRFTPELRSMPAEDFVAELLRHMPLRELHVGDNFSLGRGRSGNVAALRALASRYGFVVRPSPQVCLDGQVVSSTRIRELIQSGEVREAGRWLGRPFSLRGNVVPGQGQGHRLGFPTANLSLHPRQILPADGVYAVRAHISSTSPRPEPLAALGYVGRRPTFGSGERVVEVHLLDFAADLRGCEVRAEFVERLRADRRFAVVEDLIAQMEQDAARARKLLQAAPRGHDAATAGT